MSTESDLVAILSNAANAASALANDADSLIAHAINALKTDLKFPGIGSSSLGEPSGVTNQDGFYGGILNPNGEPYTNSDPTNGRFGGLVGGVWIPSEPNSNDEEPPVSFPAWPAVTIGAVPKTQNLTEVEIDIEKYYFPKLSFPAFKYSKIARVPAFEGTIPDGFDEKPIPAVPDTESPYSPAFIEPLPIDSVTFNRPSIELDLLSVSLPAWNNPFDATFEGIKNEIDGGVTPLIKSLENWCQSDLSSTLDTSLTLLKDRMENKLNPVWSKYTELRNRLTARLNDEENRVIGLTPNTSGWVIPAAVQAAQASWINQISTAWKAFVEEQVDVSALKMAVEWFQACGELTISFTTTIQKLKEQEIKLLLDAHKTALNYAKAVVEALLAGYDAESLIRANFNLLLEEAKLKAFEAELTIALLQYEEAQFALKYEEAKQTLDEVYVKKLKNEVSDAQQIAARAGAAVSAARLEVAMRRLPLERFELEVKAFAAQINAYEANVGALIAEVEGDVDRVEGQLKKLAGYKEEIKAFQSLIDAKQIRAEAQSNRNNAVIKEFQQRVQAALAPIEKESLDTGYDLKKYEVLVGQLIADAQLALETAKVELQYRIKQKEGQREAYDSEQERDFEVVKSELSRLEGIASVNAQGAGVVATMSMGAMSAANGIASVMFSENV